MTSYRQIRDALSLWIDRVAMAVLAARDRVRPARLVHLVERPDTSFAFVETARRQNLDLVEQPFKITEGRIDPATSARLTPILHGAKIELRLEPGRFLFRPLELPRRAGEFLDGIIRAQIDRLTPWTAADAAFGWSPPSETGHDRMVVTVAATGRALIDPIVAAIEGLGADSILVSVAENIGDVPIKISDRKARGTREIHRTRRILTGLLTGLGVIAFVSLAADMFFGADFDARQEELGLRIAKARLSLQPEHDPMSEAALALRRQKHATPSSVIVIDALTQSLPDHTYVTELRLQDDKIQIIGVTRDAPSLIRLLEQTSNFGQASFFAPTTRSQAKPGEHFHIEATIKPTSMPNP